jgi:hypothetical protein
MPIHRPAPRAEVYLSSRLSGNDRAYKIVEINHATIHTFAFSNNS